MFANLGIVNRLGSTTDYVIESIYTNNKCMFNLLPLKQYKYIFTLYILIYIYFLLHDLNRKKII